MDRLTQMGKSSNLRKYLSRLALALTLLLAIAFLRSCISSLAPLDRSYRILRYTGWYPANLPGKQAHFFAFTGELLRNVFHSYNFSLQILDVDSNKLFSSIDAGLADAVMLPAIPKPSTKNQYYFSSSFYKTGPVLIVPIYSTIDSIEKLNGEIVAVMRGSPIVFQLSGYGITFSPYDRMSIAFHDLSTGKIDAIILPVVEAYAFTDAFFPGKFKVITPPMSEEGVRLVAPHTPKGKALIEAFDTELKKMKEDGSYKMLLQKWGLRDPDSSN
jgi:ABC-type amino acid transport substrate-binding protein